MSKLLTMRSAIADLVADGASVALGLQLEQMIPFAAGHEIARQKKRDLTLIGPISDILFDQLIGAGCVKEVIAAWVGNVMMGSAYNFRRAVEQDGMKVFNLTNFSVALALQAGGMGVPFLPTRTALGSDITKGNHFFSPIFSPFALKEPLWAVRANSVTILAVLSWDPSLTTTTSASQPCRRMESTTELRVAGIRAASLYAGMTMLYFGYRATRGHRQRPKSDCDSRIFGERNCGVPVWSASFTRAGILQTR